MILADDPHDQALLAHCRPPGWPRLSPAGRYTLVVLGGGPAGLVAAFGAAALGAKVALVERDLLGGDCLVTGCVPSKALLRSAHAAEAARRAGPLGLSAAVEVDFPAVMERLRRVRAELAPHDSAERLRRAGVDVFFGAARFVGPDRVSVEGQALRFHRCLIATGARSVLPPIPGLAEAGALGHEALFTLRERPARLLVLGGGVIGCEMAQAFARLGSRVSLIEAQDRVLSREDPDASALLAARLTEDGVELCLGATVTRVERRGEERHLHLAGGRILAGDALLVAVGRAPNLDLDLARAGVEAGPAGLRVDDHLRTTNRRVYGAGDVLGPGSTTHAADHQARLVLRNALFPFGRARRSRLVLPRVTYTQPEVAAVGLSAAEAARDPRLQVFTVTVGETDRGRTDGEAEGFGRVVVDRRGRLRGALIVSEQAGELLAPLTFAMTQGLGLAELARTVHAYPTRSELVFKLASAWSRGRLTPALSGWTRRWFSLWR